MINPLSAATHGLIHNVSKRALTVAVAGMLVFTTVQPPEPPISGGGTGGSIAAAQDRTHIRNRILEDDTEVYLILKSFVDYEMF